MDAPTVIRAIVRYAAEHFAQQPVLTDALPQADDPQALGALLWAEHERSLQCVAGDVALGPFPAGPRVSCPDAIEFLTLLDWLEMASCEAPDYFERPACLAIEAMRRRAIRALPGYGCRTVNIEMPSSRLH